MIFVTIGTQEPFDRLIKVLDNIAEHLEESVIVQTMETDYHIKNMTVYSFMPPSEYMRILNESRLIVSHAGMGTVISALMANKPIVILPRIASLGEHRNEHQLATANKLKELGYAYVANDEQELIMIIKDILQEDVIVPLHSKIGEYASESLINSLSTYINQL